MRKRNILLAVALLVIGGCQFGDELIAYSSGKPVRLVSSTGSLDTWDSKGVPLQPFMHVFVDTGAMHIVARTIFHGSGTLARPYLSVDSEGHGVVHIDTKARWGLSTKCEFFRQFEIELAAAEWRNLKSLQVFNHDVDGRVSQEIQLSDPKYMAKLLLESTEQVAARDLTGVAGGC